VKLLGQSNTQTANIEQSQPRLSRLQTSTAIKQGTSPDVRAPSADDIARSARFVNAAHESHGGEPCVGRRMREDPPVSVPICRTTPAAMRQPFHVTAAAKQLGSNALLTGAIFIKLICRMSLRSMRQSVSDSAARDQSVTAKLCAGYGFAAQVCISCTK